MDVWWGSLLPTPQGLTLDPAAIKIEGKLTELEGRGTSLSWFGLQNGLCSDFWAVQCLAELAKQLRDAQSTINDLRCTPAC
eukprot:130471-Prorocentrum_minimum.AAC.2